MRRVFFSTNSKRTPGPKRHDCVATFLAPRKDILFALFLLLSFLSLACHGSNKHSSAKKWASLAPNMNEILFAVGAGDETAGVCSPADYPSGASKLPVVASYSAVDAEGIIARGVSACFTVEGMQSPPELEALRRASLPVYQYRINTLSDLLECIVDVGIKTGHAEQARRLADQMKLKMAACSPPSGLSRRRAAIVVSIEPLVVAGPDSFLSDMLRASGLTNAMTARSEQYPVISIETLAAAEPALLVFPSGDIDDKEALRFVGDLNRLMDTPCSPVLVPADILVRPGPRTPGALAMLAASRAALDAARVDQMK